MSSELTALLCLLHANRRLRDPNPHRCRIDGLRHCLQTATRAERDGAPPEQVVMALVHDAGRPLSDANHGGVIAEVMRGRLPRDLVQVLRHHGTFQDDLLHGTEYAWGLYGDEPWYPVALCLSEWEAASFDPVYPTTTLRHFLPMLELVMG